MCFCCKVNLMWYIVAICLHLSISKLFASEFANFIRATKHHIAVLFVSFFMTLQILSAFILIICQVWPNEATSLNSQDSASLDTDWNRLVEPEIDRKQGITTCSCCATSHNNCFCFASKCKPWNKHTSTYKH